MPAIQLAHFGRQALSSYSNETISHCIWCGRCLADVSDPRFKQVYCSVNSAYLRPEIAVCQVFPAVYYN